MLILRQIQSNIQVIDPILLPKIISYPFFVLAFKRVHVTTRKRARRIDVRLVDWLYKLGLLFFHFLKSKQGYPPVLFIFAFALQMFIRPK